MTCFFHSFLHPLIHQLFVKGWGKQDMLMGKCFEILVGGTKWGDTIFCGSSVGRNCQGWSIFP